MKRTILFSAAALIAFSALATSAQAGWEGRGMIVGGGGG